jgi:uncharacterized membrane protein (DUF106 family)
MIELFGAMIDLALISIGVSAVLQFVQRKFLNRGQMKVQQEEMKRRQKRMKELMQRQDEKAKSELQQLEKEMMEGMNEMMSGSMKQMFFTMVLIIPLWAFFGWNYADVAINLPIAIPFFEAFNLFDPMSWFGWKFWEQTSWIGWYVLISLSFSIVFNIILTVFKKVRGE